ncbi:cyclic nucleotide-binding domain-containing protein [Hymenobacter psychrophilus]|uniref:Cyclic nucleotide-binding domain-containing protein n=1 Tax=Hymenobacter psychrophilus TaxID=651662 RepID=A0A1H3M3C0_9BACT|nr:cyclic nucleotide-binding domain-containing protein [Hymenobacter psychrophilus]SDY71200.1 Cyclic nucleotide-binding domain-containing protein [Hymenobacter psychrophilus]
MTFLARWQQLLGIRPEEGRSVGLFFLHNFLLGIGTILVYVAANVILLENHPETSLPLAYGASALAMLGAGQVYAHYEHHLGLQRVAVRVLLAVIVLMAVLGVLVAFGESVAAAVAIMAGYRVIYLLTNLEFWGVSAVVFDVRQGRRLFSVISSGDMPAKALGAVLAILVHHHAELLWLLLLAFFAYVGALLVVRATGRSHLVEVRSTARAVRSEVVAAPLRRWLGSSRLVGTMCLSMLLLAAVTTGIEYAFFINVKERFHDQALVMRYVGTVLALTYLVAMLLKLGVTGRALDWLGPRRVLLALPLVLLAGFALFGLSGKLGSSGLLLYLCGLFLVQEVLRRAFFDPVFLVLFQPLPAAERLQAHTLAKGVYEPLGLGLGALLLLGLPTALGWQIGWMLVLTVGAGLLLYRTYGHYLAELHHAVGRRFSAAPDASAPTTAGSNAAEATTDETRIPLGVRPAAVATEAEVAALVAALADKKTRAAATRQLLALGSTALPTLCRTLQADSAEEAVVRRAAYLCGQLPTPESRRALVQLAQQPALTRREAALRALRYHAPHPADAPVFRELLEQDLQLARELLHSQARLAAGPLHLALDYELKRVEQRLFGLLQQLYPPQSIRDAQRHVAHAARERQANALEILDNLIDRPTYQGLQTLLEVGSPAAKAARFDRLLPTAPASALLSENMVERGESIFTDWTVSLALRQLPPARTRFALLRPHLASASPLVLESALAALIIWAKNRPAAYHAALTENPALADLLMNHAATAAHVSAADRVAVLQRTALFAATPANVLSAIVPIMQEVSLAAGQQIFAQGDLGTSLFIVHEGEVGIFTGDRQLAAFGPGDFFGELALLDAEPRSAAARALAPTLAFRLDQEDFYDVMEERPEVLRNILRVLCQRLRRQNEA